MSSQLAKFLTTSYRAEALTAQELKVDPGLSVTQDVVHTWRQITMNLYLKFVREMSGYSKKLFSHPEIEAQLSGPARKKQHDKQLSAFNRLQNDAVMRMHKLDEFITYQVKLRFDEFKEKVKGVKFSRLLREGYASSTMPGQSAAPPPARPHTYKPVEAFLEGRKKPFPWYTISSTGIPA